jgi:type IV secretory pathway TraG/TraD family ATPase VirD4
MRRRPNACSVRRSTIHRIRNPASLTPNNHQLNGSWLGWAYRRANGEQPGIVLGSTTIPHQKEFEHFLITGSPGSGKSTLIRHMLYQVQERGQAAIVLDPDAEYVQEFYDEARGDVILNPLDARCPFWSPWAEFRPNQAAMDQAALAASLVRGRPRDDTQLYFHDNARLLICAMFQILKERDREDLNSFCKFLTQPRDQIRKRLEGTTAAPAFDPGAHDSGGGQGILSAANTAISGFAYLPRRDQTTRTWSTREWASNRRGWVFLPSTTDARDAIESVQGMFLDALVRWLMSQKIGSEQVFIFADELPAAGYQKQIEQLAVRGRKRGLSLVMGFQNIAQLRQIYGDNGAITLVSAPSTKVVLRCDEAETAKWASELLGSHEIERLQMTQLAGLSTYREGVNLQPHRTIEHIVMPAEIQLLKPLHGYLCVAGTDRTILDISPRHLVSHHPDFTPRLRTAATQSGNQNTPKVSSWSGI